MLHPDRRYSGAVVKADWIESSRGTPGLSLDLETTDGGYIVHTIYFTPKSADFNAELLGKFGVSPEQMRSGSFMQYELPSLLVGRDVTFQTKSEEYNGKVSVKVAWFGPKSAPSDERGVGYGVAQMFGGSEEPESKPKPDHTGANLSDDDIPF